MDPAMWVTLVGIVVSALLGVFAGACHLLRSDIRDLRAESRADMQELRGGSRADLQGLRAEDRADHRDTNSSIDRLEGKLDVLIMAFAQAGFLVDPQPQPDDSQR